jgi:predicted amidohydrolase
MIQVSKVNRREFLKVSVTGGASAVPLVISGQAVSREELATPAKKQGKSEKVPGQARIATIQSNHVPTCDGLKTDPFRNDFSLEELFTSVERRLAWYDDLFDQAGREKCDLVVVTEDFTRLSSCVMYLDDRSIFRTAVGKQTNWVPERLGAAAKKHSMYIVACYYALEGDTIYNVADLFGREGKFVGRYRKVHLPQYELWQVAAGDSFPTFETDIGWISMLICYDQMWPEAAACCAMNGAQLICQPSAASLKDYHMRTRAMDNQVHFISSTWTNSMIASPRAEILANAEEGDPAIVWADVNLRTSSMADEFYWEYLFSGIQDHKERHLKFRRPETYRVLTERHPPLASQYREGGVASSPETIQQVYRTYKEMQQKRISGEPVPYHWRW